MVEELSVRNLVIGYGKRSPVAGPLSFEIGPGELVLLCGRNGSGKTTLLKTLAGIMAPVSGEVIYPSGSLSGEGKPYLLPTRIPKVKGFEVEDFMVLTVNGSVDELMESLGIQHLAGRDISTLSDGQFQKVCLAAAIGSGSGVILLDEPTAFLDHESRIGLMELLKNLTASGAGSRAALSFILSTHDLELCRPYCSGIINL